MILCRAMEKYLGRFGQGQQLFNTTVEFIKEQQVPCVFVSPHLDDAALSSGGLISELSRVLPGKVYIISIFTRVSPLPHTRHVQKFLDGSLFQHAHQLFAARVEEDTIACEKLGATAIHLDFIDAGYRKRAHPHRVRQALGHLIPEALHMYPTSFSIGRHHVGKREQLFIQHVKTELLGVIGTIGPCVIFCPVGGKKTHVDHVITRQSCQQAFPNRVIYSLDYPYSLWSPPIQASSKAADWYRGYTVNGKKKDVRRLPVTSRK